MHRHLHPSLLALPLARGGAGHQISEPTTSVTIADTTADSSAGTATPDPTVASTSTSTSSAAKSIAVWTGTLASGQPALGSSFCFDWTDDASNWDIEEGGSGIRSQSDALWSYFQQGDCGSTEGLHCIEQ